MFFRWSSDDNQMVWFWSPVRCRTTCGLSQKYFCDSPLIVRHHEQLNIENLRFSSVHKNGSRCPNSLFKVSFGFLISSPSLLEHSQALSRSNKHTTRGIKPIRKSMVWIPREMLRWYGFDPSWDVVLHVGYRRNISAIPHS